MKSKDYFSSFRNAVSGFFSAFKSEKNLRIHLIIGTFVVFLGLLLRIKIHEWVYLVIIISLVLISELFNTAIENTVDFISRDNDPLARKIKDISAAAVLIAAITSIILGILIFLPKLLYIFRIF
jgi:diacylglycerol kinase